ncbi:NAD-dependent epimerase/dehydratase family protein [Streptomyces sp. NPDC046860]|uniref:NAD-dependent epimerase/dehydratase family protein n=1 Tax=Streptomyces sp. NPDC046860 TaxID=3154495 RepID=UPI0033DC566C
MKLLVLGGTEFVGRAVVEAALERGWEVTAFNRGNRQPPPDVRSLHGDRTSPAGLAALAADDTRWDAVVDTWKGAPKTVRETARLLKDRVERYAYISTRSVYTWPWPTLGGLAEDGPLVEGAADAEATDYGADKRGGELAALESFGPDRTLLARAGLILGPYEHVGRLPYWLTRIARGGEVLAPGPREMPVQYIDVRDLADWLLGALDKGLSGPFDLTSPSGHATMGELLERCREVTGSAAELRWTDPETILAAGIEPWTELPVWTPPDGDLSCVHRGDVSRALATGLDCRPVDETVADTWRWLASLGGRLPEEPGRTAPGVPAEKEAAALGSPLNSPSSEGISSAEPG